jgi:hypothetical protein
MTIGDDVVYRGRSYRCRGFAPLGVRRDAAELEDVLTGEWISVPLETFLAGAATSPGGSDLEPRALEARRAS